MNMGKVPHEDLEGIDDAKMRAVFDLNVFGVLYMSRAAVPELKKSQGCIINITSSAGIRPGGSSMPYSMSKAAVNHMTKMMAKSQGPEVRVCAVAPSLTNTKMMASEKFAAKKAKIAGMAPLKRIAEPEDMGEAVLGIWRCKYMTGAVVVVDGGFSLVA